MNGKRKLVVLGGFFTVLTLIATGTLCFGETTFDQWADFEKWVSGGLGAMFLTGNAVEHLTKK